VYLARYKRPLLWIVCYRPETDLVLVLLYQSHLYQ